MTSPVQVALRELMILTKCYCDGEHPRLGHNCSFRPDVMRVVEAIGEALKLCEITPLAPDPWVVEHLDAIRAALLGNATDDPPWRQREEGPSGPG